MNIIEKASERPSVKQCAVQVSYLLQSLKVACTHLQCAAGAWEMLVKHHVSANSQLSLKSPDFAQELLTFHIQLMLVFPFSHLSHPLFVSPSLSLLMRFDSGFRDKPLRFLHLLLGIQINIFHFCFSHFHYSSSYWVILEARLRVISIDKLLENM